MSQATLNQILDQLQALEASELQQLSQAIQLYLSAGEISAKQVAFHRALVESGLVRQIKHPVWQPETRQPLVQVKDGAVSQTILEERR